MTKEFKEFALKAKCNVVKFAADVIIIGGDSGEVDTAMINAIFMSPSAS